MERNKEHENLFQKWAAKRGDVLRELEGCPLKVGDKVTFTNEFGVVFKNHKVIGIQSPEFTKRMFPTCKEIRVFIDYDCYWFPTKLSLLTKE